MGANKNTELKIGTSNSNDIATLKQDSHAENTALDNTKPADGAGTSGNVDKQNIPDPFDPAQFAAPSTVMGDPGVTKELISCPVRKPNRQEFFRIHPGDAYKLRTSILELKQENETYLVMPNVAAVMPGETRLVTLRLAVSRQGAVFLWPVPEPGLDGRVNSWHASARSAAVRAEKDWVKVVANMAQGGYDLFVASGVLGTPAWPDKPLGEILSIAFGENFIIRDAGHPVIKRLLGQE